VITQAEINAESIKAHAAAGQGRQVLRLGPPAIAGTATGAVLLLLTPANVFERIVPFLVAFAAVALLVQPRVPPGWRRIPVPAAGSGRSVGCLRCGSLTATGVSELA
jgi:uncharacterized membrane protein YfcA